MVGLAEGDVEHDIRRLAADAGKGRRPGACRAPCRRDSSDELSDSAIRFLALPRWPEADGLDVVAERGLAERDGASPAYRPS